MIGIAKDQQKPASVWVAWICIPLLLLFNILYSIFNCQLSILHRRFRIVHIESLSHSCHGGFDLSLWVALFCCRAHWVCATTIVHVIRQLLFRRPSFVVPNYSPHWLAYLILKLVCTREKFVASCRVKQKR